MCGSLFFWEEGKGIFVGNKIDLMGFVHANVELINSYDQENARRYLIGEEEIRRMYVNVLADSGAMMLCINENVQEILQLPYGGKRRMQTADGRVIECDIVEGVKVKFENRTTVCRAAVLPGDSELLLGVIPMEDMDVIIHPLRQELMANPDSPGIPTCRTGKIVPVD